MSKPANDLMRFLILVILAAGPLVFFAFSSPFGAGGSDPVEESNRKLSELRSDLVDRHDTVHTPRINAPRVVETASEVTVTVTVPLLGDGKHYIRRLILFDESSLVKLKYVAVFSNAVRRVQVSTPIKMAKTSRLQAIAECSLHGKWLARSEIVQVGIGGCGSGQEPNRKLLNDVIRIRFEDQGEWIQANLLFRHPMLSGYILTPQGQIRKNYEPFFLKLARVTQGDRLLAEFEMSPGLSENPRIGVLLPRLGGAPLKGEGINSSQQLFVLSARMPQ
ncbi:MAG: thiosulfate oxidation carrier complex protein SoxZ [Acidobacteria bacterium]|nr:thiosulfate oxidation carrier complex protein SoxZ [Acidobacteriota bacterium]